MYTILSDLKTLIEGLSSYRDVLIGTQFNLNKAKFPFCFITAGPGQVENMVSGSMKIHIIGLFYDSRDVAQTVMDGCDAMIRLLREEKYYDPDFTFDAEAMNIFGVPVPVMAPYGAFRLSYDVDIEFGGEPAIADTNLINDGNFNEQGDWQIVNNPSGAGITIGDGYLVFKDGYDDGCSVGLYEGNGVTVEDGELYELSINIKNFTGSGSITAGVYFSVSQLELTAYGPGIIRGQIYADDTLATVEIYPSAEGLTAIIDSISLKKINT